MNNRLAIRHSGSEKVFTAVVFLATFLIIFLITYPIIFVISASLSNPLEVFAGRMWLFPRGFSTEAYKLVFQNQDIFTGYRNTLFYAVVGTFISIVITLSGAYPLSRKKLFGKNIVMSFFVFTMFFSGGLIPTFMLAKSIGFYNNVAVMLMWGSASVYNMIVARSFMQSTIDETLYEAGEMDGCSDVRAFFSIVLPLCGPILSVLVLFYAVGYWNSYFTALIYLSSRNLYPLQLFLREILLINMTDTMTDMAESDLSKFLLSESVKYAVVVVSSIPMLILYPFMQRFFVKGIMIGALKG
jgi:putative aldouronate transport system permease protein